MRFPSERLIRAFDGSPHAGLEALVHEMKAVENASVRFALGGDELVLVVLKSRAYVAGIFVGDAYKPIALNELFARARGSDPLHYEAHAIDLPSVLVISVLMQHEPSLRAPLAMTDAAVVLSDLLTREADAAVVVCTGEERSFAFVRRGAVASVHLVGASSASADETPADRFLAYVYGLAREPSARLEVYEKLVIQRDEQAGFPFEYYVAAKAGPPAVLLTAKRAGRAVQKRLVRGGVARVGRAIDNDIVLDHPSVSREHSILRHSGMAYVLEDGGSANGTWLEGQRIDKAIISFGQKFSVGEFDVLVEEEPSENGTDEVMTLFVDNPVDTASARLLLDGHVHRIDAPVFTLGRSAQANLQLHKGWFVAGVQATIVREAPGKYRLSAAPDGRAVLVNGTKTALSGVLLQSGDMVSIGPNKLVFALVSDRK